MITAHSHETKSDNARIAKIRRLNYAMNIIDFVSSAGVSLLRQPKHETAHTSSSIDTAVVDTNEQLTLVASTIAYTIIESVPEAYRYAPYMRSSVQAAAQLAIQTTLDALTHQTNNEGSAQ